jgi:hypothetical protein
MIQKLKNIFKLTAILALTLFTGCSEEKEFVNQHNHDKLKIENKSFKEVLNIPIFNDSYQRLAHKKVKITNSQEARTALEDEFNFTIVESSPVKVITDSISTSYVLLIERAIDENLKFENLVINIKDDEMIVFIQKYSLAEKAVYLEEFETYNMDVIDTETNVLVNESKFSCIITATPYCNDTSGGQAAGHAVGDNCTIAGYYFDIQCSGGGGGGSDDGDTGNSGNNPGWTPPTGPHSNGGFGNPVITSPVIEESEVDPLASNFIANLDLSPEEDAWLDNHFTIMLNIVDYLNNNHTQEDYDFINWGINYLMQNPTVTFEQFKNWFMAPKEGLEDNNSLVLENMNLTFAPQILPSFDDFLLAYPSHLDNNFATSQQVYTAVGGAVLTKYNQGARNTCALRVSKGLNYSGVTIPNIPGVTVKGADNKNYFLVAKNLLHWMKMTFGTPTGTNHLTGVQGGINGENFPALLQGKQGIYIMIPNDSSLFEATGHADMFFDGDCDGACYFSASGGVSEIFFWVLP